MTYDENVAARVRAAFAGTTGVEERRMFGGLCFLVNGNMCCGVQEDRLVLRLGDEAVRQALAREHTSPMDFTGRPLKSMVYVAAPGFRAEKDLRAWIKQALSFAGALPPKQPAAPGR